MFIICVPVMSNARDEPVREDGPSLDKTRDNAGESEVDVEGDGKEGAEDAQLAAELQEAWRSHRRSAARLVKVANRVYGQGAAGVITLLDLPPKLLRCLQGIADSEYIDTVTRLLSDQLRCVLQARRLGVTVTLQRNDRAAAADRVARMLQEEAAKAKRMEEGGKEAEEQEEEGGGDEGAERRTKRRTASAGERRPKKSQLVKAYYKDQVWRFRSFLKGKLDLICTLLALRWRGEEATDEKADEVCDLYIGGSAL